MLGASWRRSHFTIEFQLENPRDNSFHWFLEGKTSSKHDSVSSLITSVDFSKRGQ